MADTLTPEQRSAVMACVKNKNTKPEVLVRSLLHCMGYRFRLHRKDLPGSPDIVLPRHKKIILVHGCFWHGHTGCKRASRPTSNIEFWNVKIDRNILRDQQVRQALSDKGWRVLIIWECQLREKQVLQTLLSQFLAETP